MTLSSSIKTISRSAFTLISRILFCMLFGVGVNSLFFLIYGAEMPQSILNYFGPWWGIFWLVLIFGIFLVGFPILYFLVGKFIGIMTILRQIFQKHKTALFEYLLPQLVPFVSQQHQRISKAQKKAWVQKLPDLPKTFKWMLLFLLKQLPLVEMYDNATKGIEMIPENYPTIEKKFSHELETYIQEEILESGFFWFWGLVFLNMLSLIGLRYLVLSF